MSRPLFLVPTLPTDDRYVLDGAEGHHAAAVMRMRPGERLLLGDGAGGLASAVVTAVGKADLTVTIEDRRTVPPPQPTLTVAQGIPKGDRGELAVQAMTETGVDRIIPWSAKRCVAVWRGDRGTKSRDRWAATAREAAKQSRRAYLPTIAPAAMDTAHLAAYPAAAMLVLHEEATAPLTAAPLPETGEIVLVIGPEGGIDDTELATLTAAGGLPVRLGREVLRTSTAGVAALSVLATRLRRW